MYLGKDIHKSLGTHIPVQRAGVELVIHTGMDPHHKDHTWACEPGVYKVTGMTKNNEGVHYHGTYLFDPETEEGDAVDRIVRALVLLRESPMDTDRTTRMLHRELTDAIRTELGI